MFSPELTMTETLHLSNKALKPVPVWFHTFWTIKTKSQDFTGFDRWTPMSHNIKRMERWWITPVFCRETLTSYSSGSYFDTSKLCYRPLHCSGGSHSRIIHPTILQKLLRNRTKSQKFWPSLQTSHILIQWPSLGCATATLQPPGPNRSTAKILVQDTTRTLKKSRVKMDLHNSSH